MTSEIVIKDLCRTCLATDYVLYPIFETFLETIPLEDALSSITGLKLDKNDGLPKNICEYCKDIATKAYLFKRKSWESDVSLQDLFKRERAFFNYEDKTPLDVKIEKEGSDDDFNNTYEDHTIVCITEDLNTLNATQQIESCNINIKQDKLQDPTDVNSIPVQYDTSNTFCPLCGASYDDLEGLTKHMWDSHAEIMGPKKRGRPKKLTTEFILKNLLNNEQFLETKPVKRLNCSFCKEKFETTEELITHITEHKDKVYSCAVCKKKYMKKNYFDIHLCVEDKAQGDTEMNDPPLMQPTKGEQDEFLIETSLHQLLQLGNNKGLCVWWRECASCSALLSTPAELAAHVDAIHPHLSLRCPLCNKVFENVNSARQHRVRCANVDRAHACTSCPQRFAREAALNKHILGCHAGQRASVKFLAAATPERYQCDTCKRFFLRKDLLTKHMKHHTTNKYFQCDVCNKRFYRNDHLRSHMRIHGVGGRSAATCLCLYCGRSFTCSSNFIVHMRRHTGEKPYKCDFCDKGFPRSSDLQCHRRSHTGEKPYVCEICEKSFARSNKLSRHMRVHTGARPYKCTYCDKAFSQSNDLNLHVRRHTGDKPYVCDLCGDRFIQGTALQSHRRTHAHYPQLDAAPAPQPLPLPTLTIQQISDRAFR